MSDVYQRLAQKLDSMPNGFPATDSGVELKILRKLFAPEEAEMALQLRPIPETAEVIATRLEKPLTEMESILANMVNKGQITSAKVNGEQVYILVPFLIGIVELQVNRLDKEFAELLESYGPYLMKTVGGYAPALSRVLPVNIKAKVQQEVHRYEDVVQVVEKAKSFQLLECMCRKEARIMGRSCDHTLEACLGISNHEGAFDKFPLGKIISREKALEVLAQSEDEGLVHTTYNVQRGQMFICNCCPCCCGILRSMKDFHVPHVLAKSNFTAVIDSTTCEACGVCANERCPMDAIVPDNNTYRVKPERCIGCGACTPTCPTEAIRLVPKPPAQRDDPPDNILEWAFKRAANRGIQISID